MTFLLSFGLLFGTNNAVADSSMRCSLIGAEATQQWLAKERARPEPELIPLIERVRSCTSTDRAKRTGTLVRAILISFREISGLFCNV